MSPTPPTSTLFPYTTLFRSAHRLAYMHGFSEGIFNHLTLTVPGRSDRYYQIPFGMHWSEVTASSFMEVGIDDGKVKRDRKSTRLNSSHRCISYAVFCLKKKK